MQKYFLSWAELHYELLVGTSLSTCSHRPACTCINVSQDSYLLAPERSRMLVVISVDVRSQDVYDEGYIGYCSLCIYSVLELYFINVIILYPLSSAMCVCVCVCVLSVSFYLFIFHNLCIIVSTFWGLQLYYFSNPSRRKLQEMATGNIQMEKIRR